MPLAETDDPLVDEVIRTTTTTSRRASALTYDLDGGKSVVRAGYGRFFDKTHFELIGGLYTGTPFTHVDRADVPGGRPRISDRATASLPTDPFLVNGPTVNHDAACGAVSGGVAVRNTGATWDNADRRVPHTDEITVGYERQLMA